MGWGLLPLCESPGTQRTHAADLEAGTGFCWPLRDGRHL